MPKRVLYLIRNGEYQQIASQNTATPLTERGLLQAQRTASAIRDLPIRIIYTSPQEQTRATANILHDRLFHDATLETSDELAQDQSMLAEQTFTREMLERAMDEEDNPFAHVQDAYERFFQPPHSDRDIHEVLVCPGNIILDLICLAINVNPDVWSHMLINNCAINIISIDGEDEMQLVAFNDVRHLPESLRTE